LPGSEREFIIALRGYRRDQVDAYLQELEQRWAEELAELEARLRQAEADRELLRRSVNEAREALAAYEEREREIARVILAAQLRAAEVTQDSAAEALKVQLLGEIAASRAELGRLRAKIAHFHQDFAQMLENYQLADEQSPEPTGRGSPASSGDSRSGR
jgi:DivIVA domain-containing protein